MNLYPYTIEPIGTAPWASPAEFQSVSPCVDAHLGQTPVKPSQST